MNKKKSKKENNNILISKFDSSNIIWMFTLYLWSKKWRYSKNDFFNIKLFI